MTTPELLQYVQAQLAAGTPIPTIRQNLLASGGWSEADIAEAFAATAPSIAPVEVMMPPPPSPLPNPKPMMPLGPQPLQETPAFVATGPEVSFGPAVPDTTNTIATTSTTPSQVTMPHFGQSMQAPVFAERQSFQTPAAAPAQQLAQTPQVETPQVETPPVETPRVETMPTTPIAAAPSAQQNYSFPAGSHPATNIYANPKNLTTGLQHPIVSEPRRSHKGLIATVLILLIILGGAGAAYAMPNIRSMISAKITSLEQKFGFGANMQLPPVTQPTYTSPEQPATSSVIPAASTSSTPAEPLFTRSQFAAALAGGGPIGVCYFQDGGKVYMSKDNKNPVLVPEADPATFQDLKAQQGSDCFGKDSMYAFRSTSIIPNIDAATFKPLWMFYYMPTFFQNGGSLIRFNYTCISKDSADVNCTAYQYAGMSTIANSDLATFQILPSATEKYPWARDKNNVYCAGSVIPGADPSTATTTNNDMVLSVTISGIQYTYGGNCMRLNFVTP